jgi:hypothetical protein
MADDRTKKDQRDRSRVAGGEDYWTPARARALIKKHGNDRATPRLVRNCDRVPVAALLFLGICLRCSVAVRLLVVRPNHPRPNRRNQTASALLAVHVIRPRNSEGSAASQAGKGKLAPVAAAF